MTHGHAYRLGKSHISVSTVGPSPHAIRDLVHMPARLAWSVHAADDDTRKRLMPTTRSSMEELRDAFAVTLAERPGDKGLFVEVALVQDINDSEDHARRLAELLRPLPGKTRVNLLPYNPFAPDAATLPTGAANAGFRTPSTEAVRKFQECLFQAGYVCTVRATRGADSAAACGQLVSAASLAARKLERQEQRQERMSQSRLKTS